MTGAPLEFHHVGIIVPDLEAAMAEMGALLGLEWTDPQERPDGDRRLRVTFSKSEPRIELIQGNDGGIWDTSAGPKIDHLAFWVPDFDKTSALAQALDAQTEAGGRATWGGRWAYVKTQAAGTRIELCDQAGQPIFNETWGFDA